MIELNPPIVQTRSGMMHVFERHTYSGIVRYRSKSKFNAGEDIIALIAGAACYPMILQPSGRYARTYMAGKVIGYDCMTGIATELVTVITNANGNLITAFPGNP